VPHAHVPSFIYCCSLRRPGQEEGNIPFVENAGFGTYSGEASEIADTVSSWLANPEKLKTMRQAALAAARPHATLDIAKDIAELVFAQKAKQVAVG
jgi:UDP-N-acetylglucosamine:LPS N-acetylglucosamine transferase